jgi:small subunit ribosomal protein S1
MTEESNESPLQPAAGAESSTESTPAAPKVKIGSQRPESERVKNVANRVLHPPGSKPQKVVVPNRRAVSDELEAELAEALGDFSLNDLGGPIGGAGTTPDLIEPDTRRKATVLSVNKGNVFVDLGGRDQGVINVTQFKEPPATGAVIDVTVGRLNPEEGLYQCSIPGGAIEAGDWSQVAEGMLINVRISGSNKGGLECEVAQLRGFIPAGQVSTYRIENFEEFVGQTMTCLVTEVNQERRRLVLSRRAVLEREKAEAKEQMLKELEVGQIREGTVRSLMDFGAFVDLGGVDGLLHVSRLSWTRIKHPSEMLSVGQPVKVKVTSIDPDSGKIGLSLRDLSGDPWIQAPHKYKQGDVIRGPVVRILDRVGAFIELEPGVDGLVHISEIDYKRVFRIQDFVKEGQTVEAKILSVDPEQKRISLSMKAIMARPEPVSSKKDEAEEAEPETPPAPLPTFPKKLKGGVAKKSGGAQFGLNW